jgi:hypothetical protein
MTPTSLSGVPKHKRRAKRSSFLAACIENLDKINEVSGRGELVFMAKLQGYGSNCIKQIGQVISEIVWNESDASKVGKLELLGRVP